MIFFLFPQGKTKEGTDAASDNMGKLRDAVRRRNTGVDFSADINDGNDDHRERYAGFVAGNTSHQDEGKVNAAGSKQCIVAG